MPQVVTFTPEAVRDTLLGAGFTESDPLANLTGFYITAYPSTIFVTWDAGLATIPPVTPGQEESMHGQYREVLRRAGFRVSVQAGCVPVNGLAAAP